MQEIVSRNEVDHKSAIKCATAGIKARNVSQGTIGQEEWKVKR